MTSGSVFAHLLDDQGDVAFEETDPSSLPADLAGLYPEEALAMARAVDKRRREFTAGRILARKAMRRLGLAESVLLNGEDRAPRWPEPLVGSITHTGGICAVALALRSQVRAIGIDAEQDSPLKRELWDTICTPSELERMSVLPERRQAEIAKIIFSAKECAYKAQYLLTEQYLGFQAMSIELGADTWRATFQQPSADVFKVGDVLEGRWTRSGGLIATAIVLRHS